MTTELELLTTVFIAGVSLPIILFFVYWLAVDAAKRYVNKEIREAKL